MKIPNHFRGLLYAPSTESELGILFGLLLPYMKPPMCVVEGEFQVSNKSWPDLKVKILENKRWKSCRVEFEVKSATFIKHNHDLKDYDKIICWEDNWDALSVKIKQRYKKFSNRRNRISLKSILEENEILRKRFILNFKISSKNFYRSKLFSKTRHALDSSKSLKKHIARDYISYYKDGISFIQLRLENMQSMKVYIVRRAIDELGDSKQFLKDLQIFNPIVTKVQKDLSFTIDSLSEVDRFISMINKYL